LVEKGGITVSKAAEPEIKTEEQIQKLREACKLARLVLNSAVREAKVNPK
jgi:methionine aminopeptidase